MSVAYGSITIGGADANYLLDGNISFQDAGYRSIRWVINCVVKGTNAADLESKCAALQTQIRTPRQNLTITLGSGTYSYSEGSKTAYEIAGAISRVNGSPYDSVVTREFTITFSLKLPANLASDDGVLDYTFKLTINANGQRIVEINGLIVTNGTNLAKAQYSSKIAGIVSTILNGIDNTASWELMREETNEERFDFELPFSRTYQEKLYKDSLSTFDVAALKDPRITANVSTIYAEAAIADLVLPTEIIIGYEALVDKTVSTDLTGLWTTTVVPLLLSIAQEMASFAGVGDPQIVGINPTFLPTGQVVSGQIRFICFGPQRIIAASIETQEIVTTGARKIPVYSTDPYARRRVIGLGTAKQVITILATVQGSRADALSAAKTLVVVPTGNPGPTAGLKPSSFKFLTRSEASQLGARGGGWTEESRTTSYSGPTFTGSPALPVTTCSLQIVYDYDTDPVARVATGSTRGKIVSSVYDD